jgi:hypothetical protein
VYTVRRLGVNMGSVGREDGMGMIAADVDGRLWTSELFD